MEALQSANIQRASANGDASASSFKANMGDSFRDGAQPAFKYNNILKCTLQCSLRFLFFSAPSPLAALQIYCQGDRSKVSVWHILHFDFSNPKTLWDLISTKTVSLISSETSASTRSWVVCKWLLNRKANGR